MSLLIASARRAWSRREFLRRTFWSAGALGGGSLLAACGGDDDDGPEPGGGGAQSRFASIGPLSTTADANGLFLPQGFTSRVVARSGLPPVPGAGYLWHTFPDGGATYRTTDGGWIYTSNAEVPLLGGAGALRFAADGTLTDAYSILRGTSTNCAGGKTPWNTWLSCEEVDNGMVYECDPFAAVEGAAKPAMGLFAHEAVAVDPGRRILYLTEDEGDGRFYRFVPTAVDWPAGAERPALEAGQLQVLRFAAQARGNLPDEVDVTQPHLVIWEDVVNPDQAQATVRAELGADAPGTRFQGGEGLWFFGGIVYFSTKGDNRIWAYDAAEETIQTIYDFASVPESERILSGVDNLTVSEFGDVLVAEDGGNMQICVILPDRRVIPLVQASDNQAGTALASEITGPAFSPDGSRLYFSAQRSDRGGALGNGITFEITLPFQACPSGNSCLSV